MKEELIRLEKIVKQSNDTLLLDDFNLNIFKGEILGLFSLNTVGKSSLLEILSSNLKFDSGRLYFNDVLMENGFSGDYSNKVRTIENKIKLSPNLTVAENIFVIRKKFEKYIISKKILYEQSAILFENLGIDIDPKKMAGELTTFESCIVEIVKVYALGTKLIILCDLSNYLSAFDLDKLNKLLLNLLEKGVSFLYVDNDFNVLFKMANRIVVMGDGKNLRTLNKNQFQGENVMNILLGENFDMNHNQIQKIEDEVVLEFKNLSSNHLDNINIKFLKGEIVSILDVTGKYYEEIINVLTGTKHKNGEIIFLNEPYSALNQKGAILKGIGFIYENLSRNMLFKDLSVLENLIFMMSYKAGGLSLKQRAKKSLLNEYHDKIGDDIYAEQLDKINSETECKIVYYRWLLYSPKLLVCVKPFSGQDVSLRKLILNLINEISLKGISVIVLSSNITESYILGNRIVLIDKGNIVKEYRKDKTDIIDINTAIDELKEQLQASKPKLV